MTADLREMSARLQLEVCVGRLLGHLFPADKDVRERPGRHRVLEDFVEGNPRLLHALMADDKDAVLQSWAAGLPSYAKNLRFHHTLAVLYRERALTEVARAGSSGGMLVFATALWALLLGTRRFWWQFRDLTAEQETQLLESIAKELLTLHVTLGKRDLVAGAPEAARPHVRSLVAAQSGEAALVKALGDYGLPYRHTIDSKLLGQVSAIAGSLLSEWCADIIRVARQAVDDPEAIATLPKGIEKNYEGGISHLEPFVRLGVPVPQILRTGLEWYYEWCFRLYAREEIGQISKLLEPAGVFAEQLAPLSTKGRGHLPENQVLSQYHMMRGYTCADSEKAIEAYEESLAWNPANDNARTLLAGIRIGAYSKHADELAEAGKYTQARKQLAKALKLAPDNAELLQFDSQLEEWQAEEPNLRYLRIADAAMTTKDYDAAVSAVAMVSPDSKYASQAASIRVGARFQQAVAARKNKRFGTAAAELRTLLDGELEKKERRIIREFLADVLNEQAVGLVNEAADFSTAIEEIFKAVNASGHRSAFDDIVFPSIVGTCAVCLKGNQLQRDHDPMRLIRQLGGTARDAVVRAVRVRAQRHGGYRPGSVGNFWRTFDEYLCDSCRTRLKSLGKRKSEALGLLTEAARQDPQNKTIRKNLDVISRMDVD
jgi:tetratricopeptide (TPR) repeat protein